MDSSSHSVEFNNVIDGIVPVSLPPGKPGKHRKIKE